MHGRQHRRRLLGDVHPGKNLRGLGDAGQAFVDDVGPQMLQMEINVILVFADAAPLADFDGHRAADHIARGQVLGVRRVAFHEALAVGIGQIAALAPATFGHQTAGAVDAGRMELGEFHVLQGESGAQHHAVAVAGAGVGGGRREVGAAVTAGGQHGLMGAEHMQRAVG